MAQWYTRAAIICACWLGRGKQHSGLAMTKEPA